MCLFRAEGVEETGDAQGRVRVLRFGKRVGI